MAQPRGAGGETGFPRHPGTAGNAWGAAVAPIILERVLWWGQV